jgi:acyl-CoA dehydrogenase
VLSDYATYEQAIGLDWYALDPNLRALLDRLLPDVDDRAFAEQQVAPYGSLVGCTIAARAEITDKHGPALQRYDHWGREHDVVAHHPTWTDNKADLVRAGFVGLPWHSDRPVPAVVTAARAYLVCQAETALYCALGMTSGAADIVARYAPPEIRDSFVDHLGSEDPGTAWEGGMFLTERQGGSDVGANTTRAVLDGEQWRLYGEKYFCSNIDAEVFIVLARPDGAPDGARGLATFIVPRLLSDGSPNGWRIRRLKPKLGTVAVPTGEVELDGARAWLAGGSGAGGDGGNSTEPRGGLNRMMEMVNGSRFGVALMGLGIHRRCFLEGAIYAANREQWGQRIDNYPLVRETLVDLLVDLEAGAALTFESAAATRTTESADEGRRLRRILIPLAKICTTREAIGAASRALELFGGNGYIEDWPMARQLRDAQCHTIWEGTENILSLDVLRSMRTEKAHASLFARVERALDDSSDTPGLSSTRDAIACSLGEAREAAAHVDSADTQLQLLHARRLAWFLAELSEAAVLVDEAAWAFGRDGDARKAVVARRFTGRKLTSSRARGILDDDRTVIDAFEPLVRYGRMEADAAANGAR